MLVAGLALVGWVVLLDVVVDAERRLARWWVPRAGRRGAWAGPWSFAVSLAALAGYGLLVALGDAVGRAAGSPAWALVVLVPALLAYAPLAVATAPLTPGLYTRWRGELRAAGADPRQQRRIAWWAGPPSLFGVGALALTLVPPLAG